MCLSAGLLSTIGPWPRGVAETGRFQTRRSQEQLSHAIAPFIVYTRLVPLVPYASNLNFRHSITTTMYVPPFVMHYSEMSNKNTCESQSGHRLHSRVLVQLHRCHSHCSQSNLAAYELVRYLSRRTSVDLVDTDVQHSSYMLQRICIKTCWPHRLATPHVARRLPQSVNFPPA